MARTSTKVYAASDYSGYSLVDVSTSKETFKAKNPLGETVELTYLEKSVDFHNDAAKAAAFFGGMENLINEAQDSLNAWLATQGKNSAKTLAFGQAKKLEDMVQATVAEQEAKRGVSLRPEQIAAIRARLTERLDFSDI